MTHSDWLTGKRGRRNSVGSLDSTIEVSLLGGGLRCQLLLHVLELCSNVLWMFYGVFCIQANNKQLALANYGITRGLGVHVVVCSYLVV